MAQVENFAGLLRGVADDGDLARGMRRGNRVAERMPAPKVPPLAAERLFRIVAAVDEEVSVSLPVVAPTADVVEVGGWHVWSAVGAKIGIHRGLAAAEEPVVGLGAAVEVVEHHLFVIAQERHQMTSLAEREQLLNHATAVWPAIDTVAEHHDRVVGPRLDSLQDHTQRRGAAVDVADSNRTRWHRRRRLENKTRRPKSELWPDIRPEAMLLRARGSLTTGAVAIG